MFMTLYKALCRSIIVLLLLQQNSAVVTNCDLKNPYRVYTLSPPFSSSSSFMYPMLYHVFCLWDVQLNVPVILLR